MLIILALSCASLKYVSFWWFLLKFAYLHNVPEKTATSFFGNNFGNWARTPIFTILLMRDSAGNFLQIGYRDYHLTLAVLLHYLAKYEIHCWCFKTIPSSSHNFFPFRPLCCRDTVRIWTPSTTRCGGSYKSVCTNTTGSRTWKSCVQQVEEEWDRLYQEVIDNAISEWRKRLTACIAAGGGHFKHSHSEHYSICSHTD